MEREGVTKFEAHHRAAPFPQERALRQRLGELIAWRQLLVKLELLGHAEERYGGVGFGNVSLRWRQGFVVSGTQTALHAEVDAEAFAIIEQVDLARNTVHSYGPVAPSSESMTHAALYARSPHIGAVLHVHSPLLWRDDALPRSAPELNYGTPEMAEAVATLELGTRQIFAMGGHLDGVVAFGAGPAEAGCALLTAWTRAHSRAAPLTSIEPP